MANVLDNEPSKISYFYGPGVSDIKEVVAKVLDGIRTSTDDLAAKLSVKDRSSNVIIRMLAMAVRYVNWLATVVTLVLASVSFCLFMLLPQVVAFIIIELGGLAFTNIVKGVDILMLKLRRVSLVCDNCHSRYTLPVYICPSCGAKHPQLVPGRYGALHHTCDCGAKLASSLLVAKNPRRDLDAICPNCWISGRESNVQGSGSRTILIPVVGGESAGKSALITAYAKDIIDTKAPAKGLTCEFYNDEKKLKYEAMSSNYDQGVVDKTATVTDSDMSSATSFSFYLAGPTLNPKRLIQLYDIAGETFVSNDEHEQQRQYEHCDGLVLVIDPLSLPQAEAQFGHELASGDRSAISSARLEDVMSALSNNLRETTKLNRKGQLDTPLAVVLSKVDEAPVLETRLGTGAADRLKAVDAEKFANSYDAMDFLCRQFLVDMDMADVVDIIEQDFKNSRFFAVSAIGHMAGDGTGFQPKNVDLVMDWIMSQSDPDLAKVLGAQQFSKNKLPVERPALGLYEQLIGQ